jgi:histidyl-tRNA synthetase
MGFQKPKGTQDLLPGAVERWQALEETLRGLCRRFNYREVRTPIFEQTELFRRGVGETSDVVEKEMYTFLDKGERSMTLRPEGTAGVVRAYVENKLYADPDVVKLYYIGPMFRYEQPQAGRYRQFHQFGVEAIGSADPALDAEVIAFGYLIYKELGIRGVRVVLNSVGNGPVREAFRTKLQQFLAPMLDTLCKDCRSRYDRNPLRVLDCKIDRDKFAGAPSILDHLDAECAAHFQSVQDYLRAMDIPYEIDATLVRGLDYYTHTAFEYKCEGIGAIDTVGGGGRYNGLVAQIGGEDRPGIGFGIGLERLLLVMEQQGLSPGTAPPIDVYFVAMGERADRMAAKLLYEVRAAGLAAEKDYMGRKMKSQLRSADRYGARYAAILGDEELDRGVVTLKRLDTGEQETVPIDSLTATIKSNDKGANPSCC